MLSVSPNTPSTAAIQPSAARLTRSAWSFLAAVVLLSALELWLRVGLEVERLGRLRRFFALSFEGNLPNWWSTLLMLVTAALCAVLARRMPSTPSDRRHWGTLTVVFVGMSLVEATQLRESLVRPVREALDVSGFLYYVWVVPGAVAVIAAAAYFLPFVLRQPAPLRNRIVVAGVLYVFGALVLEAVGGQIVSSDGSALAFALAQEAEEISELVGLTLLATGLLQALQRTVVTIGPFSDQPAPGR